MHTTSKVLVKEKAVLANEHCSLAPTFVEIDVHALLAMKVAIGTIYADETEVLAAFSPQKAYVPYALSSTEKVVVD